MAKAALKWGMAGLKDQPAAWDGMSQPLGTLPVPLLADEGLRHSWNKGGGTVWDGTLGTVTPFQVN